MPLLRPHEAKMSPKVVPRTTIFPTFFQMRPPSRNLIITMQKQHFLGFRAPFFGTIFSLKRVLHTGPTKIQKKRACVPFEPKHFKKGSPDRGGITNFSAPFRVLGSSWAPWGPKMAPGCSPRGPRPQKAPFSTPFSLDVRPFLRGFQVPPRPTHRYLPKPGGGCWPQALG